MCQTRETVRIPLSLEALFTVGMCGSLSSTNLRDLLECQSVLKSQAQVCTQATGEARLFFFFKCGVKTYQSLDCQIETRMVYMPWTVFKKKASRKREPSTHSLSLWPAAASHFDNCLIFVVLSRSFLITHITVHCNLSCSFMTFWVIFFWIVFELTS